MLPGAAIYARMVVGSSHRTRRSPKHRPRALHARILDATFSAYACVMGVHGPGWCVVSRLNDLWLGTCNVHAGLVPGGMLLDIIYTHAYVHNRCAATCMS
jgi:hypothetical protein